MPRPEEDGVKYLEHRREEDSSTLTSIAGEIRNMELIKGHKFSDVPPIQAVHSYWNKLKIKFKPPMSSTYD